MALGLAHIFQLESILFIFLLQNIVFLYFLGFVLKFILKSELFHSHILTNIIPATPS